ncbi:RimJ/RimL family protein N-acetyltransferase [Aquimarina sp. MAR_2010_214]|uniref:GNAT family N-acetyltransferase n=1 Tax=Aquimarina sp. MAR_2010_214 TaxID=1250026 RepID=UPI000C6FF69C|nr:GNAT family N-acetyltransferase [Aquimarina sp. MAR_2010_214]PKV51407.1 RimJ/RimL family protein N-acetyltransferase [Aquimarina sp. MAR_2010_214]
MNIKTQIEFRKLDKNYFSEMMVLIKQLNPNRESKVLEQRLKHMFESDAYHCFGLFKKGVLIGLIGCWKSIRLYSGRQLELDNVIIDTKMQSKGYGKLFFNFIEDWALKNGYQAIGLNTYVENSRSHKFYFNEGFRILGFHFQKMFKC